MTVSNIKLLMAVIAFVQAVVVSWQLRAAVILPCMHHSPWKLHFDIQGLGNAFEGFCLAARSITTFRAPSVPKVPPTHNSNISIKLV